MPEFQPYLDSIARHYDQWWRLYTLTDAEGKEERSAAPLFDFGLVVQTITPKDSPEFSDRPRPKIERFPVTKGLQKYAIDHVLLVGRPGSGKSTALARLMLDLVRSSQIPVLVELRSYQSSILELIRSSLKRHDLNLTIAQIEMLLDDRKLILLIDGVNELPSESARIDLSNFRQNHSKVSMIFTTRDLSLGGDLGIEKQLEMQPLTEIQMRSFINAYLPGKADAMLGQLKDRLREFGTTPLLLWMLCSLFKRTEVIPQNLGEVFRAFTRGYEQQIKQDVVLESDRRLWFDLLKQLAAAMMQGEKPTEFRVAIAPAEICAVFADYLKTENPLVPRQALDDLLKHHLIQRNGELVEFRHQLIQEYYAAEWLLERVRGMDDETLECEYLNYLKWTEPVNLILSLEEDITLCSRIIQLVLNIDFMLGIRLVRNSPRRNKLESIEYILTMPIALNLKVKALEFIEPGIVFGNLFGFINQGYNEKYSSVLVSLIESQLIKQIKDDKFDEEDFFCYLFGNDYFSRYVFDSSASTAVKLPKPYYIYRRMLNDIEYERKLLRNGFFNMDDSYISCGEDHLKITIKDPSSYIRLLSTFALGELKDTRFVPELTERLKDESSIVKTCATEALGKIGGAQAIKSLISAFDRENEDLFLKIHVARALHRLNRVESTNMLWDYVSITGDTSYLEMISELQLQYQFYNYEIYQKTIDRTSTTIARASPSSNTYAIKAEVVQIIENNYGTVSK